MLKNNRTVSVLFTIAAQCLLFLACGGVATIVVPDTTTPTVTITSPANGDTISGTISVTGIASNNVVATSVQFKLDGANLGSADAAAPYTTSWDTTLITNGLHVLTAIATDTSSNTAVSSSVTVTVNNLVSIPSQTYGPGFAGDCLDNHQISNIDVDYRFRAAYNGVLKSIIWYDIFKATTSNCGYSSGTGGSLQISIQTDDGTANHLASGVVLGYAYNNTPKASSFPEEVFSSSPTLVAGTLYHIHWHNIDPSPTTNFVSVDSEYVWDATIPRQPTVSDTDLAVFRGTTLRLGDSPILEVNYVDGSTQGQGYMVNWNRSAPLISGATQVREQFTVTGPDRVVSSVSLRMKRHVSNTGNSPLTVRLETGAGTLIEEGTLPAYTFPVGDLTNTTNNHNAWGTYTFTTPRTLASGQSYHLVLISPADTVYSAPPIRRGRSYGFSTNTFFADGYGQYTTDSGSTWWGFDQPGGATNTQIADLQFYFVVNEAGDTTPPVNNATGLYTAPAEPKRVINGGSHAY